MKLLLTSNGITNAGIERALVELLGKPIADASALFVATGMYPFENGLHYAWQTIAGKTHHPFPAMGWKTFGNLELSVLPSLDESVWRPAVAAADAIIVWGGDPIFLAYWMRTVDLVVAPHTVYVGTSAGSMAACAMIGETYLGPRRARGDVLSEEPLVLPDGPLERTFMLARGMGWLDAAVIPHYGDRDATEANTEASWMAIAERSSRKDAGSSSRDLRARGELLRSGIDARERARRGNAGLVVAPGSEMLSATWI